MIRRGFRWLWAVLLLIAGIDFILYSMAMRDRQDAFMRAQYTVRVAAEVAQKRMQESVRTIDRNLSGIGEVIAVRETDARASDLYTHRLLLRRNALTRDLGWIILIAPDGRLSAHSTQFPAPPIDLTEREYFRVQADHWDHGLYIGPTIVGKLNLLPFIPLSRRIVDDRGRFIGVIAAGLRPEVVSAQFRDLSLPGGYRSALFLTDGTPILCFPEPGHCPDDDARSRALFDALRQQDEDALPQQVLVLDDRTHLRAYASGGAYPLVVGIELDKEHLTTTWYGQVRAYAAIALGCNLALLLLAVFAARQSHRRRAALEALEEAKALLETRVAERTEALHLSETRARLFMNTATDAVVVIDGEGRFLEFNPAAERMFGYERGELLGRDVGLLIPAASAALHWEQHVEQADEEVSTRAMGRGREVSGVRRDGSTFPIEATVGTGTAEGLTLHVGVIRDITRRKAIEDELQRLATIDSLTGVLNRRAFLERGEHLFATARRHERELVAMIIDADRFKTINDTYGHHAGDAVLKAMSAAIAGELRATDVFGRMGGEEFALILPETDAQGAEQLGKRLLDALRAQAVAVPGHAEPVRFTASIGSADLQATDETLDTLLHRADLALYAAKSWGRDRLVAAPRTAG